MKILIILIRWEGGVGRIVNSVKTILEKEGHEVEVISREDDLKCYSTKEAFFKLRKEVKKRTYDILYNQDWSCALPFLFKKNHYIGYHGFNPGKLGFAIQKVIGRIKGNKVIVVSDRLKKVLPKSNVIWNGVNFDEFKELNLEREYLGYIKRSYEPAKDMDVEELKSKFNVKDVIYAENIPPEKMNEWYNKLKVFLSFPPKYAGFNLCWLEAKAAGVPRIFGNENGVGLSNIGKHWKEMSIENHAKKLLEIFKNEKDGIIKSI